MAPSAPKRCAAISASEQLNYAMKVKNQTFNVNVSVTSVNGNDVKFDMVETLDKNQVAGILSNKLTQQVGRKPDSVTCPDNLKGVQGATLRCELTDSGQKYGISVTVTNVDAGDVSFDYKVDDRPESTRIDPNNRRYRAAFLRSISARAAASSARCAAELSQESCRFLTTLAGAPTAIE